MKRIILLLMYAFIAGRVMNAQSSQPQLPDFIHTTYSVGGSLHNTKEIECSDYDTFQFIYLMAAPQWNEIDFDVSMDSIYQHVNLFEYEKAPYGMPLVPQMINTAHEKGTRVLLSFAGEGFNAIVENTSRRKKFINYMIRLIDKHNYDGIEIDWETGVELGLHAIFIHEIRTELNKLSILKNKYYYLTTALHYFQRYDQKLANKVSKDVDWINIMTYDMGGGIWGNTATHNTPLAEIKTSLEHWKVFSPKQLCIGLANYGFRYKNIMPGQKIEGKLNQYGQYFSYNDFLPLLNQGWKEEYDKTEQVSYYFSPDRKEFITMENPSTILEKIKWITQQGYRGVFWWEFHYDFILPDDSATKGKHHLIDIVSGYLKPKSSVQ